MGPWVPDLNVLYMILCGYNNYYNYNIYSDNDFYNCYNYYYNNNCCLILFFWGCSLVLFLIFGFLFILLHYILTLSFILFFCFIVLKINNVYDKRDNFRTLQLHCLQKIIIIHKQKTGIKNLIIYNYNYYVIIIKVIHLRLCVL